MRYLTKKTKQSSIQSSLQSSLQSSNKKNNINKLIDEASAYETKGKSNNLADHTSDALHNYTMALNKYEDAIRLGWHSSLSSQLKNQESRRIIALKQRIRDLTIKQQTKKLESVRSQTERARAEKRLNNQLRSRVNALIPRISEKEFKSRVEKYFGRNPYAGSKKRVQKRKNNKRKSNVNSLRKPKLKKSRSKKSSKKKQLKKSRK